MQETVYTQPPSTYASVELRRKSAFRVALDYLNPFKMRNEFVEVIVNDTSEADGMITLAVKISGNEIFMKMSKEAYQRNEHIRILSHIQDRISF